jgi:hypothetical protein
VAARLASLTRVIAREQAATRLWYDGWVGFFGAGTLVQASLAATASGRGPRVAALVGGAKAATAFTFMLLSPARARTAADTLARLPEGTPAERRDKLRRAEGLLRAAAAEERDRRGLFPLLGGALLNLAGAFTVWGATRGAGAAWFGLGTGIAISQLQLYTQPRGAVRAWEAYARGEDPARIAAPPAISIAPVGMGLGVVGSF